MGRPHMDLTGQIGIVGDNREVRGKTIRPPGGNGLEIFQMGGEKWAAIRPRAEKADGEMRAKVSGDAELCNSIHGTA
jgi:hypothetical protein